MVVNREGVDLDVAVQFNAENRLILKAREEINPSYFFSVAESNSAIFSADSDIPRFSHSSTHPNIPFCIKATMYAVMLS